MLTLPYRSINQEVLPFAYLEVSNRFYGLQEFLPLSSSNLQVAFENSNEQNNVGSAMKRGNVREVWTSGRLCDKEVDGCEQDRFQPYNIRGWFWASTLQSMGETNVFNGRKVR